jgi:tight adherence protein B
MLKFQADSPRLFQPTYVVMIGFLMGLMSAIFGSLMLPMTWWQIILGSIFDGCVVARMLFGWQQRRCADQLLRQLPDVLEMVVSAVRAGLPIGESFQMVAREAISPTKEQFAMVSQALSLGTVPDEALRKIYDRTHVEEYAIFSVTLAVQSKSGGKLADTLQILCDTVRKRVALSGRANALAGEARLSAQVLAALPVISCILMYFTRPDSFAILFHDPRGQRMFAYGVILLILGILTMRRMIQKGTTV